jgi:PAS domain S-box-containing protein
MFAPLADHAHVGLFVSGKDGSLIYVNERWCEMAGISAKEATGDGWVRIIHPEDRQRVLEDWGVAVAAGAPYRGEFRFLRPDGRIVWIEGNGLPVDSPLGGDFGYMGTCVEITERRQAETLTRLYEAMFANSPDFAYVFDTHYRFIYANQSLLTMWGRTWEEAVGKRCLELGYPDWHAEMHEREIDTVISTREPIRGDVPFNGTHGRRIYEYIFTPVIGENGEVEAVAGATRDVTERKQAEERANLLVELAGKLAPLGTESAIMRTTVEMVGRHLNAQRCYFVECLKAENLVRISCNWLREGVESVEGEFPLDSYGGEEWWARYSGGQLAVENTTTDPLTMDRVDAYMRLNVWSFATQPYRRVGAWTSILAVSEDHPRKWTTEELQFLDNVMARVWPLIEQTRNLQAIRTSRQRLATIAETGRHILEADSAEEILRAVCGAALDHLKVDIAVARLAGGQGEGLGEGFHSGVSEEVAREIADLYLGDLRHFPEEVDAKGGAILRREGAKTIGTDRLMVGDELLGFMIFAGRSRTPFSFHELEFLDTLSHYVTAACVRLRLLESLRESDRRKDLFLATLAHELRNPLAPVLTGLEIMKRSKGDVVTVDHVTGIIERQTEQMAHLIDDLLDISRINTGKIVLRKEISEFARVLKNAIEASQPLFEERGHSLEIVIPPSAVQVDVDPARIAQVVSNLLSNAAKYTPNNGRIRLVAGVDRMDAWVSVTDNGQGIDPRDQLSIFELFHQTSNGSADGLGIGLTLVKSLVEMHGGSVTVESEGRGMGSTFRVSLPGCVKTMTDAAVPEAPGERLSLKKRVLVVDDGKNAADMLAMFFRLEGMEADVAYDGREGLEKSRTFDPDFVIMDIGMPVMDGLEAARCMRADKIRAKIIALSGWGRDEDKERTAKAGFDHHMTKPVSPDELRKVMARYL